MILEEEILMKRKISNSDAFFEGMLSAYDLSGSFCLFDEQLPDIKFENKTADQALEEDYKRIYEDYERAYLRMKGEELIEHK